MVLKTVSDSQFVMLVVYIPLEGHGQSGEIKEVEKIINVLFCFVLEKTSSSPKPVWVLCPEFHFLFA